MCLTKHFTYCSTWKIYLDKSRIVNGLFSVFSRLKSDFVLPKLSVSADYQMEEVRFFSTVFDTQIRFNRIISHNSQNK